MIDAYLIYRFLKLLITPFEKWPGFATGVIDSSGKILVSRREMNGSQKDSFSRWDLLVANIKKFLSMLPGGSSKLATYAAALALIREKPEFFSSDMQLMTEASNNIGDDEDELYRSIREILTTISEDGDAPVNTVGGGAIAGLDSGIQTRPGKRRSKVDIKNSIFTDTRGQQVG